MIAESAVGILGRERAVDFLPPVDPSISIGRGSFTGARTGPTARVLWWTHPVSEIRMAKSKPQSITPTTTPRPVFPKPGGTALVVWIVIALGGYLERSIDWDGIRIDAEGPRGLEADDRVIRPRGSDAPARQAASRDVAETRHDPHVRRRRPARFEANDRFDFLGRVAVDEFLQSRIHRRPRARPSVPTDGRAASVCRSDQPGSDLLVCFPPDHDHPVPMPMLRQREGFLDLCLGCQCGFLGSVRGVLASRAACSAWLAACCTSLSCFSALVMKSLALALTSLIIFSNCGPVGTVTTGAEGDAPAGEGVPLVVAAMAAAPVGDGVGTGQPPQWELASEPGLPPPQGPV